LTAILLLAGGWIAALRRRVEQRTTALREEIELHKRTEFRLEEQAGLLTNEILERKQIENALRDQKALLEIEIDERKRAESQVELTHQQLLRTSRQAGMANVATSVLHNVGNVLNSVNVSATLLAERLRNSSASRVRRIADFLRDQQNDLGQLLTQDPKGRQLDQYISLLAERLAKEQSAALSEVASLSKNIDHIKKIVAMQQGYVKAVGVAELISPAELLEDALRMNSSSLASRHSCCANTSRSFRRSASISTKCFKFSST